MPHEIPSCQDFLVRARGEVSPSKNRSKVLFSSNNTTNVLQEQSLPPTKPWKNQQKSSFYKHQVNFAWLVFRCSDKDFRLGLWQNVTVPESIHLWLNKKLKCTNNSKTLPSISKFSSSFCTALPRCNENQTLSDFKQCGKSEKIDKKITIDCILNRWNKKFINHILKTLNPATVGYLIVWKTIAVQLNFGGGDVCYK